jgi:hypothetical protein
LSYKTHDWFVSILENNLAMKFFNLLAVLSVGVGLANAVPSHAGDLNGKALCTGDDPECASHRVVGLHRRHGGKVAQPVLKTTKSQSPATGGRTKDDDKLENVPEAMETLIQKRLELITKYQIMKTGVPINYKVTVKFDVSSKKGGDGVAEISTFARGSEWFISWWAPSLRQGESWEKERRLDMVGTREGAVIAFVNTANSMVFAGVTRATQATEAEAALRDAQAELGSGIDKVIILAPNEEKRREIIDTLNRHLGATRVTFYKADKESVFRQQASRMLLLTS